MAAKIILLGTGGPKPDPDRQGPSLLLKVAGKAYLFDAGRGVTTRLLQAGTDPRDLDAIFITHHHFDHVGALGDLLLAIWNSGRTRPLPVFGPSGTRKLVATLLDGVFRADIAFRVREAEITGDALTDIAGLYAVHDVDAGPVYRDGDVEIACERVSHGHGMGMTQEEWHCLGYRAMLEGRAVAISGDTVACAGLDRLARDADVLVLCCYLADEEQTDFERDVVSRHIIVSSAEAGKIARACNVGTLVLTHIRRKSAELLASMQRDVAADFGGRIIVGRDLLEIGVGDPAQDKGRAAGA